MVFKTPQWNCVRARSGQESTPRHKDIAPKTCSYGCVLCVVCCWMLVSTATAKPHHKNTGNYYCTTVRLWPCRVGVIALKFLKKSYNFIAHITSAIPCCKRCIHDPHKTLETQTFLTWFAKDRTGFFSFNSLRSRWLIPQQLLIRVPLPTKQNEDSNKKAF